MYDWRKLRRARIEAGLSPRELAEIAGLSKETINRFERGHNMRPSTVRKLASALGREIKEFIETKEE